MFLGGIYLYVMQTAKLYKIYNNYISEAAGINVLIMELIEITKTLTWKADDQIIHYICSSQPEYKIYIIHNSSESGPFITQERMPNLLYRMYF